MTPIEPDDWIVAFHKTSQYWWVRLLACGKYKHVSAFAWVLALDCWVVFEVTVAGTKLRLIPGDGATDWLVAHTWDADLVRVKRQPSYISSYIFCPFCCTSAIASLLGLRCGALRPDALYRHIRANGGIPVDGAARHPAESDDDGGCRAGAV